MAINKCILAAPTTLLMDHTMKRHSIGRLCVCMKECGCHGCQHDGRKARQTVCCIAAITHVVCSASFFSFIQTLWEAIGRLQDDRVLWGVQSHV